ncbi:LOG family protein [Streptomyces sp. NPDC050610]|uniref:LOG family protein n=1 Tax=Streptomyces sp. NPDC050610 TaxID=3157097 RepID=UPI00342EB4C9
MQPSPQSPAGRDKVHRPVSAEPKAPSRPSAAPCEIASVEEFDAAVAAGSLGGCRVQSLDLTERGAALLAVECDQAVFLGCRMPEDAAARVRASGALVFPPIPELPFDPYRSSLYRPEELFEGLAVSYESTPDALSYAWYERTRPDGDVFASMLRSIHDDSVSDALDELLVGAHVVGVMGGHALERGSRGYAGAARLGRALSRAGLTVATGGGPGAMEAANLGAYAAPYGDAMLDEALELLAKVPSFVDSVGDWAAAAFAVRERWPAGGASVALPTWFYGHEPPNAFAAHIAKYFANAIREDGLLARSNAGVVFLPGAAGTVQEIFDNATSNYYGSHGEATPMVLVDRDHWTRRLPAWPLLEALAEGRAMAGRIALVDSVDEAPEALARLRAAAPAGRSRSADD